MAEERLRPRRHAELAAYARWEYGPSTGPEFLLAEVANGGASGRPRHRRTEGLGILAGIAKAMKALVTGNGRRIEIPDPAR